MGVSDTHSVCAMRNSSVLRTTLHLEIKLNINREQINYST